MLDRTQRHFYVDISHAERKTINAARIRAIVEVIRRRTGIEMRGLKVLEFGCNTGFALAELARLGNSCTGVDVVDEFVDLARRYNEGIEGLAFVKMDDIIPFEDGTFDFVFSTDVIEHVPVDKRGVYFREFRRVMKDDGIGYVSYPNFLFPFEQHYRILFHHWIQRLLHRKGLIYEDIPSRGEMRQKLTTYFECLDVSSDFLDTAYVLRRYSKARVFFSKALSKTPFAPKDFLLLLPKSRWTEDGDAS